MEGDVFGVRITPPVLQFFNTKPNVRFELPITVKNVSKSSKNIRYYGPKSENFGIKVKNPENAVAPGLAVSATVHFQSSSDQEEADRIVLTVDGSVIEIPIYAHPSQPLMDFDDAVNFGTVVANSKVVAKEITVLNTGSKSGEFKVKYTGNKPIAFIPSSGIIPPHSEQKVKVEYVTRLSGKFQEVAEVYLEGREMKNLHIGGFVTERALELLSVQDENTQLQCIRFGNTYYGTDCTQCAILYNNGPELVNFVAVVDEDALAQELGVDLTQTTTAALAEEGEDKSRRGHTNEITSLITAIPNQGVMKPYQKIPIFFRFSPRWHGSKQGWKSQVCPPPRKDFALFMRLQIIGSSNGFISEHQGNIKSKSSDKCNVEGAYAEVALTGTALPVLLNISPANKFDFGECPVGEHADILCTIKNESNVLPTLFEFRRIAHFTAHPPNGKIFPGQTQDVIFSFAPKQAGSFSPEQLLDVIGQVADKMNPTAANAEIIFTLPIKLSGLSNPITIKPKGRFNKGITPYISNEVGLNIESTFDDLEESDLRNAVAGSTKVKLHQIRNRSVHSAEFDKDGKPVKVAFPNDRAQSIRPFNRSEQYQSLFTRSERHNYVDPDYSLDDLDIERKRSHKNGYVQQLHKLRERRSLKKQKKEYLETNNAKDIGIKNGAGIFPKKLKQEEILADPLPPVPPNAEWKLLSTKELAEAEKTAVAKPICDGLNAVPTTAEEKRDCSSWLTPQQLHQIVIGPPTIDFESVCLRSVCQRELNIINNLDQHIHVVAEIDCRELRQSSPLSQVIPPKSKAVIPIIFESNTRGRFQRSVMYTVNSFYKHHVTVLAEVVPVSVDLSTERLVLKPSPGMPAEAGFRNVITLYNTLNYPAEFTWSPDLGEKGTAFSIRPATGVVEPGTDLDCEVVWHPSYMAPEDGSFTLLVNGGDSRKLTCRAELGPTNVYFLDQRISFGAAPVNLTTVTTAILHNAGNNHGYFQVLDPNPLAGLTVSPVHGVVPVGGSTEIRVVLTPDAIMKFDTRVQVSIRGGKTIELRIGGTVEPPDVNIDVSSFNFGGVFCGSTATMPFRLENKASTKCRLEFDLTRYKDFALAFPGCQSQEDYNYQLLNQGMSSVTLEPEEIIEGEITFTPTQVAAYDFIMPVVVNHLGAPTPAPTPFPPTPAPSNKNSIQHIINPRPVPATVATPRKQIIATALRQPLQLGTNRLEFILPSSFHDISTNVTMANTKAILLVNNSNDNLTWGLDLTLSGEVLDKGIFKFVHEQGVPFVTKGDNRGIEGHLEPGMTQTIVVTFCPETSGQYQVVIPVVINSNWDKPFQFLEIYGELKAPEIWFDPHTIVLTPVPLLTEVFADFTILASHYRKANKLSVQLPEIECDDGTNISPLSVTFTEGAEIQPCSGTEAQVDPCALHCKVTFSSPKPVSFSQPVIFMDDLGNSFLLHVTATADNCLLTCYPFMALHRGDHQIVCEQGSSPKGRKLPAKNKDTTGSASGASGEAVFVPCSSPNHMNSRPSTSATSSNFQISSSSYETSTSVTDSSDSECPGPRDGAMNKPPTGSDFIGHKAFESVAKSAGSAIFPDEDSEEGIFHMEVLLAAQRWFSSQGWPGGPYPILIPETLRVAISKKTAAEPAKNKEDHSSVTTLKGVAKQKGKGSFNKLAKTIYDMISFLSGRSVPGIPINSPLPADPVERVKQIYWQHCTLLTFLRCQGACVAGIQPEYLMAPGDFVLWRQLQRSVKMELLQQGLAKEADKIRIDDTVEEEVFEAISKRMWTDISLQIMKVLILAKVTPKTLKSLSSQDKDLPMPVVNSDPLSSNIYSVAERILLAWMNHHYENYRKNIWKDCPKGGVPPSRWIVNFDYDLMDGLVLASLLGAHMPFLIKSHLNGMYTHPTTAEQCLHNALKVVTAMRYAGIDYDIQAIDITDPNPIPLLLLAVHLYQRLPQYLPKATMEFTGSLHATVTRQVKVTNTSPKNLVYNVFIAGNDARDFVVPKGSVISIPPKSTLPLSVEFKSRFLRPAEAVLVLVGKRQGAAMGNTMTFNLVTEVDNIKPKKKGLDQSVVKVESPCYELERIMLEVTNPFPEGGHFRIVLIESNTSSMDTSKSTGSLIKPKEKKVKKVRSKTDHGKRRNDSPTEIIPMNRILEQQESNQHNSQIPYLQAFSCPMSKVKIETNGTAEVEVDFLPFTIGECQCSVIFLNENIGEFLYSIEAKALDPLPSYLPYTPSKSSVRISSAAAAGSGRGMFGGDDSVIYWKCESGQMLKETLLIPVTNMIKERALILAAQQKMTDKEMQRRQITGTMMSCSVTSKTIKSLSNNPEAAVVLAKSQGPVSDVYRVEVNSEYFKVPECLVMPSPLDPKSKCIPHGTRVPKDVYLDDGVVELPVSFRAKEPGHYPATITLRSVDDIRVYRIECTVNPEGSTAELEFNAPVHQSVTQNIPVMNVTNNDWPLKASIQGDGFSGPSTLLAKAFMTTTYPLVFKPLREEEISGKLILTNKEDGTEHVFHLTGKGQKPLALDQIKLHCGAKSSITHTVKVPNVTKKKLTYRVESDLPFVTGQPSVTVLPNQTGSYNIAVTPTKRGKFKGVVAFIAGANPVKEVDSDGEEVAQDDSSKEYYGYRMWYALEVTVKPPVPERTMNVVCACQKKAVVEVIVRNPTVKEITLQATVNGRDLSGPVFITLPPGEKDVYSLTFAPSQVGKTRGSLIFFNEDVGEFWYDLMLHAESPPPTTLPHMECELGRWTKQNICLNNPTDETLELIPTISNTNNFALERDNERPILLRPHSSIEIPLNFMPSSLGEADHLAKIIFISEQLGEWIFVASGTGLLPRPQEPVCVYTTAGTNTTLIIPFRNPTDLPILASVHLTESETIADRMSPGLPHGEVPFKLLLKHDTGLRVGPKSTLEVPISFAPSEMINYQAFCTVVVKREDGQQWPYVPQDAMGHKLSVTATGLDEIRWLFPVMGVPESNPMKDCQAAAVTCQARDIAEQRLEVTLAGVVPGSTGTNALSTRAKTPKDKKPAIPEGVVVGNTMATAEEFSFELSYNNDESRDVVENSLSMNIMRHYRDPASGLVTIVFNVRFTPCKTMDHQVKLLVRAATGGLWRFPLRFIATEPPVDDTVLIEASGLGKPSSVGFRLNSQQKHPAVFKAYFESGSDPEFSVTPQSGELMPGGTPGTLFSITFLPNVYGKLYHAKLIIQTPDMQWSYSLKGVLPEYQPPRGISAHPIAGPHPIIKMPPRRINYIRDNLKLTATAVSSPIKGASLLPTLRI